jgi:hypothetical protein
LKYKCVVELLQAANLIINDVSIPSIEKNGITVNYLITIEFVANLTIIWLLGESCFHLVYRLMEKPRPILKIIVSQVMFASKNSINL